MDEKRQTESSRVIDEGDIMRQNYRPLNEMERQQAGALKDMGLAFYMLCDGFGCSRELSLAKTKIEEAVMWGIKHLTR